MLSWDRSEDASSYEVEYYSRSAGEWKTDGSYESGTSYISYGMNSYDSYEFHVRAVGAYGHSEWVYVTYEKAS